MFGPSLALIHAHSGVIEFQLTIHNDFITMQNNIREHIGYEPVDLTVHTPPPPKTIEGGFIFFA